jgi:4-hydroxyacetophenone monooxygenase
MQLDFLAQPISDDDETIRARVADVPLAPLLAAVAHLTGDDSLVSPSLRPDPSLIVMMTDDGYRPEQVARGRTLVADALIRFRDNGCKPAPDPSPERLRMLIEFVSGPLDDDYLRLFREELALGGVDTRQPSWRASEVAPERTLKAAVIGAGMSGIVAAHRLLQAGFSVHVYEKNADVGGTWLENGYPGCRVDVPNHLYSYSFAQSPNWPQFNSTQPVLLDYFKSCVTELGLGESISYEHEVEEGVWNDRTNKWTLRITNSEGVRSAEEVDVIVSAVGQLNRPSFPDIRGIDAFEGESFHSARWDHDLDFDAKRVGVVGSGASAIQFIPWLAERAEQVTIYQRTPPWLLPIANYHDDLPSNLRWVLRHVPEYARWDRLALFTRLQEGLLPRTVVDPEWDLSSGSVSAQNDEIRQGLTAYYEFAFPDPALREKVLPTYPFGAKRMVVDSGLYSSVLQSNNVTLETETIEEVSATGITLTDGRANDHDVIIYGTGFQASRFLTPMRIVGRGGVDLHARWSGDARAYLGLTVPGFPNLFLMYGPNTNIVVNGSIIYFSECQAHYIVESLRLLLDEGAAAMDCRPEVHDAYNVMIDAATKQRAWGASDVSSWYKNEFGRVAQNWPFNLFEYWRRTKEVDGDDYALLYRT